MEPKPLYKRKYRTLLPVSIAIVIIFVILIFLSVLQYEPVKKGQNTENSTQHQTNTLWANRGKTSFEKAFSKTLTPAQKDLIDELRHGVEVSLTHDYMHTDSYLMKWLTDYEWNVDESREMIMNHLKWRSEQNVDNILEEDFSYWIEEFPCFTDGHDLTGRPDVSLWDLRKVVASGRSDDLLRYGVFIMETGVHSVLRAQAEGHNNVTQGILLVNMKGFNLVQHGCMQCIPVLMEYLFDATDQYPGWLYRIILINTPESLELILALAAPAIRGDNKDAVQIFGTNRDEWEKVVFSLISRDQVRPQFGGTLGLSND